MNAHQTSPAVPGWTFDRTALVHVNATPVFDMERTLGLIRAFGCAFADMKATSNVFAAVAIGGLVTILVRPSGPAVLVCVTTVAAPTGAARTPSETTNATALPVGTIVPSTGV